MTENERREDVTVDTEHSETDDSESTSTDAVVADAENDSAVPADTAGPEGTPTGVTDSAGSRDDTTATDNTAESENATTDGGQFTYEEGGSMSTAQTDSDRELITTVAGATATASAGNGSVSNESGAHDDGDSNRDSDGENDGTETEEDGVEPVELLVTLAKDGEIDPWDIDIVAVTDAFLDALDEVDLRISGRALFYASVLLRMKSDELLTVDQPDPDTELAPWEAPFADDEPAGDDGPAFDPIESLEREMERRLERKHARGKPETLDELVRELRDAERGSWWKSSRSYDTSDSPRGYHRGMQELSYHTHDGVRVEDEPTAHDVTHTSHEEDIESIIDDVEEALSTQYERGRDEVLFAEISEIGGTRVLTYLAVLFLAHRGRIRLEQDELFGDLWIQRVTIEAEPSEAIAD